MRITVLLSSLLLSFANGASAADGGNTNAQDAMAQFERVAARFYTDGTQTQLHGSEKLLETHRSLSAEDKNLCLEVCRNVNTQRQTFQFMAAQRAGQ